MKKMSALIGSLIFAACVSPSKPAPSLALSPAPSPDGVVPPASVTDAEVAPDDLATHTGLLLRCSMYDGLCLITVSVNDSGPLTMAVDTGMSITRLNSDVQKRLSLRKADQVEIRINDFVLPHQDVISPPSISASRRTGAHVDGALGANVLKNFVVEMNGATGTLILFEPRVWHADPSYTQLAMELVGDAPVIHASVAGVDGRFVVDTGQIVAGLVVTESFQKMHSQIFAKIHKAQKSALEVSGGHLAYAEGVVPNLKIARDELHAVRTSFLHNAVGLYADAKIAGGIGAEVLKNFDVVFDYPNQKMYFKKAVATRR